MRCWIWCVLLHVCVTRLAGGAEDWSYRGCYNEWHQFTKSTFSSPIISDTSTVPFSLRACFVQCRLARKSYLGVLGYKESGRNLLQCMCGNSLLAEPTLPVQCPRQCPSDASPDVWCVGRDKIAVYAIASSGDGTLGPGAPLPTGPVTTSLDITTQDVTTGRQSTPVTEAPTTTPGGTEAAVGGTEGGVEGASRQVVGLSPFVIAGIAIGSVLLVVIIIVIIAIIRMRRDGRAAWSPFRKRPRGEPRRANGRATLDGHPRGMPVARAAGIAPLPAGPDKYTHPVNGIHDNPGIKGSNLEAVRRNPYFSGTYGSSAASSSADMAAFDDVSTADVDISTMDRDFTYQASQMGVRREQMDAPAPLRRPQHNEMLRKALGNGDVGDNDVHVDIIDNNVYTHESVSHSKSFKPGGDIPDLLPDIDTEGDVLY